VQHGGERVLVTRHGKEVAAVVSIEDARLLDALEDARGGFWARGRGPAGARRMQSR
jgi:antitoxin (DNA-binding transcriptional repressor) of toxin-antitoxin stability system